MYRIALIIGEVYTKYLPFAEKHKISLNLDITNQAILTDQPDELKQHLDQHLDSALRRSSGGEITITLSGTSLDITDHGTILSKSACRLLSHGRIQVTSRIGFGTTVSIDLTKNSQK